LKGKRKRSREREQAAVSENSADGEA